MTQQAALTAAAGADHDQFGDSVALSADGNTALVGTNQYVNGGPGVAYVFVRRGSAWSPQQRLTAADGAVSDEFGDAAALSADGTTALIGATKVYNFSSHGAAYVFVRNRGAWSQQQRLGAADGTAHDVFGVSAALSADGTTSLIGADARNVGSKSGQGTAYVFGPRTQATATATNRAG